MSAGALNVLESAKNAVTEALVGARAYRWYLLYASTLCSSASDSRICRIGISCGTTRHFWHPRDHGESEGADTQRMSAGALNVLESAKMR